MSEPAAGSGFRQTAGMARFRPEKLLKVGLFSNAQLFQDLYCLEPGHEQAAHVHENAAKTYFVIEGRGRFLVGEEERELGPGGAVCAAAGEAHGVRNDGPERLVLLVTMAPNPSPPST